MHTEFGIYVLGHRLGSADAVLRVAVEAEALGFDSLWAGERLFYPGRQPDAPIDWDPLTVLSFLAARTERIRLGTSTLILPYHQPLLLAKTVATLDRLSGGRVTVGVGVGSQDAWVRAEYTALGLPFEERGVVCDEYIAALKALWTNEQPEFHGRFCSFGPLTFAPRPIQAPHPPIWVAGNSERAMRRAIEFADGWQPELDIPRMEIAAAKFAALAKEIGRSPVLTLGRRLEISDSDVGSGRSPLHGGAKEVLADLRRYVEWVSATSCSGYPGPSTTSWDRCGASPTTLGLPSSKTAAHRRRRRLVRRPAFGQTIGAVCASVATDNGPSGRRLGLGWRH